jgi:hypothetical protein
LIRHALLLTLLAAAGCSSSPVALKDAERAKLDPALQRLVTGDQANPADYHSFPGEGGQALFSVIVHGQSLTGLERMGYRMRSVLGDMAVAHLTIEQILTLVRLPSIRFIENGGTNELH